MVSARRSALAAALCAACANTADDAPPVPALDAGARPVDGGGACEAGGPSAQFRGQVAPPDDMRPGERAAVSLTFDNCSGARWTAGAFAVVARPGTVSPWGVARVALPRDVAPGERVTVAFEVQAPIAPGAYRFAWALSRDGAETLQEFTPEVTVQVRSSASCALAGPVARFRTQTPPPRFVGQREAVRGTVTFANCGSATWTRAAGFALVPAVPDGRWRWGVTRIELPRDVPSGAEVTVPVEGTTPDMAGVTPWAWSVAQGEGRIGEASPAVDLVVSPRFDCASAGPAARFVDQHQPAEMDPAQSAPVDLTFANCSDAVWDATYRLQSVAPAVAGRWGVGAVPLPFPVAPGFRATTSFRITAPREAGAHAYRWAVARGDTALPDPSPSRTITVRLGAGPCEARPVPGGVTDPYGWRIHPIYGDWRLHTGIDFAGRWNVTEILACRAGVVVQAGWRGSYGNTIELAHGGGMTTLYAHQNRFANGIGVGATVSAGQVIGIVGTTGASTGAHLHFEVRLNGSAVDPAPYL